MRLITTDDANAQPLKERIRFSWRGSVVGVVVLAGYAAGVVALSAKIPAPIVALNGAMWAFLFWYWQRHLRRTLFGKRRFLIARGERVLLLSVAGVDKDLPDALDRSIEVPLVEVRQTAMVQQRTTIERRQAGGLQIESIATSFLRLSLRDEVSADIVALIAAIKATSGFQVTLVHVSDPHTLELQVPWGQRRAVAALLRAADPRLSPREEALSVDLTGNVDDATFNDAMGRLEAGGEAIAASAARDRRDVVAKQLR